MMNGPTYSIECDCDSNSSDDVECCPIFNCSKSDLIKSGFYKTKRFGSVMCCGCGWKSALNCKLSIRHLNFVHKINNPDCKMSSYVSEDLNNFVEHKKSIKNTEEMMRDTFEHWKNPYPKIEDLVQAGFYYTGLDDAVSCIACRAILDRWSPQDVPIEEHKKASPSCELLAIF